MDINGEQRLETKSWGDLTASALKKETLYAHITGYPPTSSLCVDPLLYLAFVSFSWCYSW